MQGAAQGITERLARASAARPGLTFAAWALTIVAAVVLVATSLHGLTSDSAVSGNPESARADELIGRAFRASPSVRVRTFSDVIVVSSPRYAASDPRFRSFVADLVRRAKATGGVFDVRTYLEGDRTLVSRDGHAALVQLAVGSDDDANELVQVVRHADSAAFDVAITGDHTVANDFNTLSQRDLEHGELAFGLPAALIVLVLVFASVVAALVPVLTALVSIIVALGLVALISIAFSLSVFIVNMLTGMGLALGIDYSLFVISRYREERASGFPKDEAIAVAGATASRAVLFSGTTFVIALLGMLIVPTSIMRSLAIGAILVGIVSVAAALTLLPALLSVLGDRVNALRVPILGRRLGRTDAAESRFWGAIVHAVVRRPAVGLVLATSLLVAAAVPTLDLHIGASGVRTLPADLPSRQGFVALERYFPVKSPYPVEIVVEGGGPDARAALVRLKRRLARDPRFGPGTIRLFPKSDVAVLTAPVRGEPAGGPAIRAVRDLHDRVIPETFGGTGATVLLGGTTQQNAEYFDAVTRPTPYVFAFVLGLSLILLTIAFRSLAVALVSIVLNLLSVGAAYGLLTLVFLHGYAAGFFGFQQVDHVDAWVPLFLFSVLFGLSMDYQVFLMSRIKERYDQIGSTREAVVSGVAGTARIITGAALIIVVVFSGFARGDLVQFQQMGFGVAVALLIDATIIRSVLLPSMLTLLDERAWYLPRWLDWLPHLEIERATPAPVPEAAPAATRSAATEPPQADTARPS
jgi:RND superfamily putative drug exporter